MKKAAKWYFPLALILTLTGNLNAQQEWHHIDSLKLLPPNPDTSDVVKIVAYTSFPTSYCELDSFTLNTNSSQISMQSYHASGMLQTPCESTDTITIGKLGPGNYTLIYRVENTSKPTFDSDTINFTVTLISNIKEKKPGQALKIFPNPAASKITIRFPPAGQAQKGYLLITDVSGRAIRKQTFDPAKKEVLINTEDLAQGYYTCSIFFDGALYKTEKFIVKH